MIKVLGMFKPKCCSRCPFWCGNHCSIDLYLNLSESVLSQYGKNEKRFFYPDRECLAICPIRETEEIEPLPTIAIGEAKEENK